MHCGFGVNTLFCSQGKALHDFINHTSIALSLRLARDSQLSSCSIADTLLLLCQRLKATMFFSLFQMSARKKNKCFFLPSVRIRLLSISEKKTVNFSLLKNILRKTSSFRDIKIFHQLYVFFACFHLFLKKV